MISFLMNDVFDVDYQFVSKEESLKRVTGILKNHIKSKNENIELRFELLSGSSGVVKLVDNKTNKENDCNFKLSFSEEYNKWFIDLSSTTIIVKSGISESSLIGVFAENLQNYINNISN